jgi:hypothetical protein
LANLVDQVFAVLVVARTELLPPIRQSFVHLTDVSAQAHEIKGSAKALLLNQTKRGAADALLKTRLHHPNFAHITGKLSAARNIANAGIENIVNRILQRRVRMLALLQTVCPAVAHIGPQYAGQQKARRHRLAFTHPTVGVLQG